MNFLDGYIQQARPAMQRVGRLCELWGNDVLDRLDTIIDLMQDRADDTQYVRKPMSRVADAAGNAEIEFEIPLGACARLVSAACSGAAAGAGTGCFVYRGDSSDDANLVHVFNYGQRFSDSFPEGYFVNGGDKIVFRFTGQPAGQRVTANLRWSVVPSRKKTKARRAGETEPLGLASNDTAIEPNRHFPDMAVLS